MEEADCRKGFSRLKQSSTFGLWNSLGETLPAI